MRKKNVAFFIESTVFGGHEIQAIQMIRDACAAGCTVTIIAPSFVLEKVHLVSDINLSCIEVKPLRLRNFLRILFSFTSYPAYKDFFRRYDLVIICGGTVEACWRFYGLALMYPNQIRFYVPMFVPRSWPIFGQLYEKMVKMLGFSRINLITISDRQRSFFGSYYRTLVVPNFNPNDSDLIANRCISVSDPTEHLCFVGRLHPQKGLIELCSFLVKCRDYFRLTIIGDGPQMNILRELTKDDDRFEFWGFLQIDEAWMKISRFRPVLILNSIYEGEPLVVKEALSWNIPVVARNISGLADIVLPQYRFDDLSQVFDIINNIKSEGVYIINSEYIKSQLDKREDNVKFLFT